MGHQECLEKGGVAMRWVYNPNAVEPPEPDMYECPVCGEDIPYGTLLYYRDNECVGCEHCLETKFVEDVYEEDEYAVRERLG